MKFSRLLLIFISVLLFVGLITYSAVKVRHPVDGKSKTELFVTERSLTHSVERGADGKLVIPGNAKKTPGKEACPT